MTRPKWMTGDYSGPLECGDDDEEALLVEIHDSPMTPEEIKTERAARRHQYRLEDRLSANGNKN